MSIKPTLVFLALFGILPEGAAAASCRTMHGRASFYGGDGQLRIWHIGTHHEYTPDRASWVRVMDWLLAGVSKEDKATFFASASTVLLFGNFVVCPTEPYKQGWVQEASVLRVSHRVYAPVE